MRTDLGTWLRRLARRERGAGTVVGGPAGGAPAPVTPPVDIAPDDPLLAHAATARGAIDLHDLVLDSPAVAALRAEGVRLVVPLVAQGELIGLLNVGPRLSEQDYSSEDRKLLDDLAGSAAPAVRVAQLVRQQEAVVRERSRIEQELRVATLIQQQFLPRELHEPPGWQLAAHYQPAREVGGDFYDVIELPGGLVGLIVGDVTDKGVPAALIMAKTHSILRADAPRLVAPGAVLRRANDLLVPEMPASMFVTCLYAVLDPATGHLRFANAGHPVPYVRGPAGGVGELRARGMPLGLLPGMDYEEHETTLAPGDGLLLHSDGVAEAHDPQRRMFGFGRLAALLGDLPPGAGVVDAVLSALRGFTGPDWEQEDDITLVTLRRVPTPVLADFTLPSEPGNERLAAARVVAAVAPLHLPPARLDRLRTAVAEATMNAIEHGNGNDASLPVAIVVRHADGALTVRVTDRGDGPGELTPVVPDIDAKLAGEQSPRGWGLFLIRNMVDELRVTGGPGAHTLELVLHTGRSPDADGTG